MDGDAREMNGFPLYSSRPKFWLAHDMATIRPPVRLSPRALYVSVAILFGICGGADRWMPCSSWRDMLLKWQVLCCASVLFSRRRAGGRLEGQHALFRQGRQDVKRGKDNKAKQTGGQTRRNEDKGQTAGWWVGTGHWVAS